MLESSISRPRDAYFGSLGPVTRTENLLGNDGGDVNENGKKAIGLDQQNNNFFLASRFLVHSFTVTARLRRENA